MHIISMLFLQVLLLFSGVLRSVSVVESVPTYERQDPLTGESLLCDKCPPGTHMSAHCTATTPTQCAPCRGDHYTEFWNYLSKCLYCNTFCSMENQEVEKECTAVSNRVCRCKQGFYLTNDFCMGHSECGPGHGVQTNGTQHRNTVCERCSNSSFSSSSSALDPCLNHQTCASGLIVLLPGSPYHDTVCGSCADFANGGETFRTFLSGFFSMHRMRLTKMKRFVSRYIIKCGEERRISRTTVPRQRDHLLDQIRDWLAKAPEDQLKNLPQMLKSTSLSSLASKLEKRLSEIEQQNPNCSSPFRCTPKD